MSSSVTLTAATRQNLLSLQDTASLLSTTQNRLSTGKKVNSALDNPINFFTSQALSTKSTALSSLLDGISNGIQTIQAANTGITKLKSLTDQLKSVAQQALASSNSFSSKATTISGALPGATASNLLSTGNTQAVADTALGASSPTVAAISGSAVYTATTATAATATGTGFTPPANAVAGTATGGAYTAPTAAATLTVTSGTGAPITLNVAANATLAATVTSLTTQLAGSGISVAADGGNTKLVFTGAADGSVLNVQGSDANLGFGTNAGTSVNSTGQQAAATQTLTINGTAVQIKGGNAGDSTATVLSAAEAAVNAATPATGVSAATTGSVLALTGKTDGSQFTIQASNAGLGFATTSTTTNTGAAAPSQTLTINGTLISIAGGSTQQQAINAINAQSAATGVTASQDATTPTKIKLSGASDGSNNITVLASNPTSSGFAGVSTTYNGVFSPTATSLATSLGFTAGDSFSVNGQSVNVTASDTISSLVAKVSTATNGSVSASFDPSARKFTFTAADANTSITLGNGSTATSRVSNLGYSAGKTNFAAGLGPSGSTSPLSGSSLTVKVGNGPSTSFTFGSAPGQVQTLTQLNSALASVNAQASIDSSTGKISITSTNDTGADDLTVTASGVNNPFTSGTSSAIVGGDGANTRNGLVSTYNNLLTQINQLAADAGYNGVNLLSGDTLKMNFNDTGTSSLSVQGTAVTASNLGLNVLGTTDFQENSSVNKVISAINSASASLQNQASSLGSNLAVVQNRQDFTKQMINVLDTGSANLTNADMNEEAANSQALSTRNSLGISALSLASQAQQGVLQLLR